MFCNLSIPCFFFCCFVFVFKFVFRQWPCGLFFCLFLLASRCVLDQLPCVCYVCFVFVIKLRLYYVCFGFSLIYCGLAFFSICYSIDGVLFIVLLFLNCENILNWFVNCVRKLVVILFFILCKIGCELFVNSFVNSFAKCIAETFVTTVVKYFANSHVKFNVNSLVKLFYTILRTPNFCYEIFCEFLCEYVFEFSCGLL